MSENIEVLDGSFPAQCERIKRLVVDGCATKELASLLLSYYAMGRNEASNENCDAAKFAKATFNPEHDATMMAYRASRPAKLIID